MQTKVIKITSFYLFKNFLYVVQEFYDDKVVVKTKSLKGIYEYNFFYDDVQIISEMYHAADDQRNFGFYTVLFASFTLTAFFDFLQSHTILLQPNQFLFISGFLLFITGFIKRRYITFEDKDDKPLTFIMESPWNREVISQVVERISSNSSKARKVFVTNFFPEEPPIFEHVQYNFANLVKITEKFYKDELVGFQEGIFQKNAYVVEYSQLTTKTQYKKRNNNLWSWVFALSVFTTSSISGLWYGFGIGIELFFRLAVLSVSILAIFSLLLSFIKQDFIGLYGKNGNIRYGTSVNRKSRAKVEEIIKFIHSRILAQEEN